MSTKQAPPVREIMRNERNDKESLTMTSEDDSSSSDESLLDSSVSLQLSGSVYDDAWLAPLVGLYGPWAHGRKHSWQCSLVLLLVNLVIQGMLLLRIGGPGGLLDEAQARVDRLVHEEGESHIISGICRLSRNKEFDATTFVRGVPPLRVGERLFDCRSSDTRLLGCEGFDNLDLDKDGTWTAEEAADYKPPSGYKIDVAAIHANMLNTLRQAALAVKESGRFAASSGSIHQAQAVLNQLARRNDSIASEVYATQVRPFTDICYIGDPLLCGDFFLRGALNRTDFLEPLRSRGFEGLPLLFLANNWMGADEVPASMVDICKVALERICPSILSAREVQFRSIVKDFCGVPDFHSHLATVLGNPDMTVLATRYSAEEVYAGTMLTKMYIGFLGLILLIWILSMLDEFNQLLTWWRVNCGLLCCSGSSEGYVKSEDGALEVISVPKWYLASALLTNVAPRTMICFTLTVLGTQFLLAATCFQDLIMNGVALTFLITVDEIMFTAIVPSMRKDWIGMVKPVTPPPQPKCDWVLRKFVNEIFWLVFIAAAIFMTLYWHYMRPRYGKVELGAATNCLCQGAGRGCLVAETFGGYPDVPTALEAMRP